MRMYMGWLSNSMAYLNVSYPWMDHDLFDGHPMRWIWVQHLTNQAPTSSRAQVINSRWIDRVLLFLLDGCGAGVDISGIEGVRQLGDTPGHFLEVQAIVDDTAGPDVDEAGVICYQSKERSQGSGYLLEESSQLLTFAQELLWSDVRFTPTETCRHVNGRLPGETIDS